MIFQAAFMPDGSELAIIHMAEGKDRLEFPVGKVPCETAGYLSDLRVSPRGDRIALFGHPTQWEDRRGESQAMSLRLATRPCLVTAASTAEKDPRASPGHSPAM
jgi:hypothetical protein